MLTPRKAADIIEAVIDESCDKLNDEAKEALWLGHEALMAAVNPREEEGARKAAEAIKNFKGGSK